AFLFAVSLLQPASTTPAQPAPADVSESAPVPVPPASDKALRYYASGNVLWMVDQVVSNGLLVAILFTGFSAVMRRWAQRIGRNWFFTLVVYFVFFTVVTGAITLP